ncbi:MAG TPA: aspartyl protease family protein, partial [Gemmataceae bacterium]|nr:aspartyl protease family protein [Gemmataceae bacterium]
MPSTLEVQLIPEFDLFGNQYATIQVYDNGDGLGPRVTFGIYDTGASPVTYGFQDQYLFTELGQPIPVIPGATVTASGIGGELTGLVSQPGTLWADGLHALDLEALLNGQESISLANAAKVEGVQAMVGTDDGSPNLPTITGTPIMNGSLDGSQFSGVAALIDQYGYLIDFGALFPELPEFQGLIIPMPDLFFVEPGTPLEAREDTTEVVRLPVEFIGIDNHLDPGEEVTESYNPVFAGVSLAETAGESTFQVGGQTLLFDTGAQLSVISTELALSLGLDLDRPEFTIDVGGAGGTLSVGGYVIDSLTVPRDDDNDGVTDGELVFRDVPIFVLDIGAGLDGIFGMNLLNPAAQALYDPWDPDGDAGPAGPAVQMTFLTGEREGYDDGDLGNLNALFPMFAGMIQGQSVSGFSFNTAAPVVAADDTAVTADEGQTATNSGTFADADGDAVTLSASVGTVTWDAAAGTWNWSLPVADGPGGPTTVTVTATDDRGAAESMSFTYTVRDVAPTVELSGNSRAKIGATYVLQIDSITDPGADTVTHYCVNWGDGSSTGFVSGSPAGVTFHHIYWTGGSRTITVDLVDEDGVHTAAGIHAVTAVAPDLRVRVRAAPTAVYANGIVKFAITVANTGTADATGAFAVFNLPAGLRLLVDRSTPGWEKVATRRFRLDVGDLAAGESRTVVVRARIAPQLPPGTPLTSAVRVGDDGLGGMD